MGGWTQLKGKSDAVNPPDFTKRRECNDQTDDEKQQRNMRHGIL